MKDEDIKLPNMPCLVNSVSWNNDIEEYARQAVRMNSRETYIAEQAKAWMSVAGALNSVMPGWLEGAKTGQDAAVKAILDLGAKAASAQPKTSDPEPFDLARAMAGEPIVTRDGRKARFVAHVPEADIYKVVVFVDGEAMVIQAQESGLCHVVEKESKLDLFMAPKPKRTVFANLWNEKRDGYINAKHYDTEDEAREAATVNFGCPLIAIAHPIEIDATE